MKNISEKKDDANKIWIVNNKKDVSLSLFSYLNLIIKNVFIFSTETIVLFLEELMV